MFQIFITDENARYTVATRSPVAQALTGLPYSHLLTGNTGDVLADWTPTGRPGVQIPRKGWRGMRGTRGYFAADFNGEGTEHVRGYLTAAQ